MTRIQQMTAELFLPCGAEWHTDETDIADEHRIYIYDVTINYELSTIHYELSIINYQLTMCCSFLFLHFTFSRLFYSWLVVKGGSFTLLSLVPTSTIQPL